MYGYYVIYVVTLLDPHVHTTAKYLMKWLPALCVLKVPCTMCWNGSLHHVLNWFPAPCVEMVPSTVCTVCWNGSLHSLLQWFPALFVEMCLSLFVEMVPCHFCCRSAGARRHGGGRHSWQHRHWAGTHVPRPGLQVCHLHARQPVTGNTCPTTSQR